MTPSDILQPKPDRKDQSDRRRIGPEERRAMADYYEAGLRVGKTSDELLEHLSELHDKSPRQIQRYIAQVRDLRQIAPPQEQRIQTPSATEGVSDKATVSIMEGRREGHEKALRDLLQRWQGQINLTSFLHNFVFSLPSLSAPIDWPNLGTPEGLMVFVRHTNFVKMKGLEGVMEGFYKRNRKRYEVGQPVECALPVESDPLMPLLKEHLEGHPLLALHQQWKQKWHEYSTKRGYWSGVVTVFSLGRIIVNGIGNGNTWDTIVQRIYSDRRFRREISELLEPTARLVACHLLAMKLSKMKVDPKRRSLIEAIEVERTKAEGRLESIKSKYKVESVVLFREFHEASQRHPASPVTAELWPHLAATVPEMLRSVAEWEPLFADLDHELRQLLVAKSLPGSCPQCPDAVPRATIDS